jgi:dipeptide/tripeptide permease
LTRSVAVSHRDQFQGEQPVIVLGIILILVGYLLPVPAIIATIGWVLLVIGLVLLVLGQVGRPVGGRRYWY